MTISKKDAVQLWGAAAGHCSKPGCDENCIKYVGEGLVYNIGEMAHVIAESPDGPRGDGVGGDNSHHNLILLCPTHHREVDKAPDGTFPVEMLRKWKHEHESLVLKRMSAPKIESPLQLWQYVYRKLSANRRAWKTFGPSSEEATQNPMSTLSDVWVLRKVELIVPNNRAIINAIDSNIELVNLDELDACYAFFEHAEGFEASCYDALEGIAQFPQEFGEIVEKNARI